ncbi:MAG: entericidin A/B family lipoprotein [Erythrobacter sp.]
MKRNSTTGKALILGALAALSMTAAACNTVKGAGEDISSVGRAGEREMKN